VSHNAAGLRARSLKRKAKDAKSPEALEAWRDFMSELRDARLALNLTHRDVADGIGVTLAQLSGWERGVNTPHSHDLVVWMRFIGLAPTSKPIE
jgi:DNA-binding transcriptional regulator YiaG